MKLRDAAKRARIDLVEPEIGSATPDTLVRLLRAVTSDFHTIRKTDNHLELARRLIAAGASVDREMVHQASRTGIVDLANLLISHMKEEDLFAVAAVGDSEQIVKALRDHPDRAATPDDQGRQPLHFCCASALGKSAPDRREAQVRTATLLIDAGFPVDTASHCCGLDEVTPLFHACWTSRSLDLVRLLMERGAKPTGRCLFAAVGHWQHHGDGAYDIAQELVDRGVEINQVIDGRTMLHAFAAHEDERGVRWLLEHGADVSAMDTDGRTPLHAAAVRNTGIKTVNALLEHGADPTAMDQEAKTPLDLAQSKRRTRIIDRLNE